MKRTVIVFGLISGALAAINILLVFLFKDQIGFDHGMVVGYTIIVLSLLLVFFGIRSYRENVGGGRITFGRAFAVGISIALISSACYVVTWEIVYFNFMPDFCDQYTAHMVEKVRASGAGQAAVDKTVQDMKAMKVILNNPWLNAAVSFIEPFPIGLLITLISAAILRKKGPEDSRSEEVPSTATPLASKL